MKTKIEIRHLVGSFSQFYYGEHNLDYERLIIEFWGSIPLLLRSRTFTHDGCKIVVSMDWTPARDLFNEQSLQIQKCISDRNVLENLPDIFTQNLHLPVQVAITGSNRLSKTDWYADFFVESYVYDLFIALNLALPGVADFYNVTVECKTPDQTKRLKLSAYYFETAFRSKDCWPTLQYIDTQTVSVWFNRVRIGFGQVPETPIERAIFAILHVCHSDGRPEDIVWLFYAFESLFQTRSGENYSAMVDRICLLLQPNSKQKKGLCKNLREMYDFRSAFVHGGLSVIHPMHNEVMDNRVEDQYSKTIDLSQYGTKLLLACLQQFILKDWCDVRFKTSIEPVIEED